MDPHVWKRHALANTLQSILLLAVLAGLLALVGFLLWGGTGLFILVGLGLLSVLLNPALGGHLLLRLYGARRLHPREAPTLHAAVVELSERADLRRPPSLAYIPSPMVNAFATGPRGHSFIAVTDGLLRTLDARETIGVLAHEVAHVAANDLWVMGLADLLSRLTHLLSLIGQIAIFVSLPLILVSDVEVNWLALLLLVGAPSVSALAQLGLSRTREFHADLNAARLSGDPAGLALALRKLDRVTDTWWERMLFPGRRAPVPSYLRTHPPTEERVRRLQALTPVETPPLPALRVDRRVAYAGRRSRAQVPRWHISGLWH